MDRRIKFGLILFVVLLVAAIVFFGIVQPGMQEREIKRLLNEANYCAIDSDCIVLDTNFGCPFGCHNLGNRNADLTRINTLWEAYQKSREKSGSFCVYSCITSPEPWEIKCVNNKCVDARF